LSFYQIKHEGIMI